MKIFGLSIGKEKPMPFPEFRDHVRLKVRRSVPGAQLETRDFGFVMTQEGKPPTTCNLRSLYAQYSQKPSERDALIDRWIGSLTIEIPDHSWSEAQMTLRPMLKNADYLQHAQRQMQKNNPPDQLGFAPFAGDLSVIVMRELPGTVVAVTQSTLESWGKSFEETMQQAINNLNMQQFPVVSNTLLAGSSGKRDASGEEVGLVFEGDHLTASWLVIPRFRDFCTQRLQGDFVAYAATRSRLTVVRADESGLIAQVQATNRNLAGQPHWLTHLGFLVSSATTGGTVSVYKAGLGVERVTMDPNSQFAASGSATPPPSAPHAKQGPVDLSAWGGLAEATEEAPPAPVPGRGH